VAMYSSYRYTEQDATWVSYAVQRWSASSHTCRETQRLHTSVSDAQAETGDRTNKVTVSDNLQQQKWTRPAWRTASR
jgi:hypothetical protein